MTSYDPVIGLEIHAQVKTISKMFCGNLNDPDEKHPNINVCPVCMGHPGTLPVPNREAINKIVKAGLALNCKIASISKFDRKNYFYPDLPKGYQISQYDQPFCSDGYLRVNSKKIRIERIHLEEDTGRLFHTGDGSSSLVDFNRAGIPLMELVTKPDLKSGEDIEAFARELQLILRYLRVSDADMEKGQMRVEVNLSLRKSSSDEFGTKVEVKNINSINAAARAADYEIKRQSKLLDDGRGIVQETRGWNEFTEVTVSQRVKEGSADYRYFPEPDIPPIEITTDEIAKIRASLPELPSRRRERLIKQYGVTNAQAVIFTMANHLGTYFEQVISELKEWDSLKHIEKPDPDHMDSMTNLAANYIITEFPNLFNLKGKEINEIEGINITPENFGELIVLLDHGKLSSSAAKTVLQQMAQTGEDPSDILEKLDLGQTSDKSELAQIVDSVLAENEAAVHDYRNGKTEVLKFLVGKVMAKSRGKANPEIANKLLTDKLKP